MDKRIQEIWDKIPGLSDKERFNELVNTANYAWRINELKSSEELLAEAKKTDSLQNNKENLAKILGIEAKIAYSRNMLDQALEKSIEALNIYGNTGNPLDASRILNNIGVFYSVIELNDKALEYFLESNKRNPDDPLPLSNAGEIYERKGNFTRALDLFLQALDLSKKQENKSLGTICTNLGSVYYDLQEIEKGREFYKLGLKENLDKGLKTGIIMAWLGLGRYHYFNDDYDNTLEFYNKAMTLAEEVDNDEYTGFCFKRYIELYEKQEDFENLSIYLRKQLELREKVFFSKVTRRFMEIETAIKSEKKELEAKQMVEKSARLASIGVMAAGITHEINQPLSAIKVCSDSMQFWDKRNPGNIPDHFKLELKQISRGVDRIDEIIRHMRSFWVTPDLQVTDLLNLNDIITYALSLIERQIRSHGIELRLNLCNDIPMVRVNQTHAEQIVINLVTNSMHSLDEIDREEKYITLTTICRDNKIYFNVEDNGKGIPQEYISQIFDPFYSTRKPGKGMGLGLAIVKQYLDEMNGKIEVINREKGVVFKMTLPPAGIRE